MKQGVNQRSTRQPFDDDGGAQLTVGDPSSMAAEERIQTTGGDTRQQSDRPAGNGHRPHDSDAVAPFLCPGRMQNTPNLMSASSALTAPRPSIESPLCQHLNMRTQKEASLLDSSLSLAPNQNDDRMTTKVDTLLQILEDVMDILDENI